MGDISRRYDNGESKAMKHVLITRFALRWPEGHPRRKWEQRPGWVQYRMELFRKYCLPSVQAQTFKDFDWWFLVNFNFPGFMNKTTNELNRYGTCKFMTESWSEEQPGVGAAFSEYYKDEWVCSTRIDSDDIMRNDFMERVHALATEEDAWIGFRNGYMMKDDRIAAKKFLCNPFMSHVEYASPFKSVFHLSHKRVYRDGGLFKKIDDVPGWIQVDHSDNVKNLVGRKIHDFEAESVPASTVYEDFTWNR